MKKQNNTESVAWQSPIDFPPTNIDEEYLARYDGDEPYPVLHYILTWDGERWRNTRQDDSVYFPPDYYVLLSELSKLPVRGK